MSAEIGRLGGAAAAGIGIAAGVVGPLAIPLAMTGGSILGGILGGSGGQSESNAQYEGKMSAHRHTVGEMDRLYLHNVESRKIKIRNDAINRQVASDNLHQRRNYGMSIQDYEYDKAMESYWQGVQTWTDQANYNGLAEIKALTQQDRRLHEQLVGLEFEENKNLLDYTAAVAGLDLKKSSAKFTADIELGKLRDTSYLKMEDAKTNITFNKRQLNLQALKASGQLAGRGTVGVSVGKAQQGIKAELGAAKAEKSKELRLQQRSIMTNMFYNQRSIVNQLLTTTAEADLDLINLNSQLDLDQAMMTQSRDNLKWNDAFIREQIHLKKTQADLNNNSRVPLMPSRVPELPPVIEPPIPEYAEVFKPYPPDEPEREETYYPVNPWSSAVGQVANFATSDFGQQALGELFSPKPTTTPSLGPNDFNLNPGFDFTSGFDTQNTGVNLGISNPNNFNLNPGFDFNSAGPGFDPFTKYDFD